MTWDPAREKVKRDEDVSLRQHRPNPQRPPHLPPRRLSESRGAPAAWAQRTGTASSAAGEREVASARAESSTTVNSQVTQVSPDAASSGMRTCARPRPEPTVRGQENIVRAGGQGAGGSPETAHTCQGAPVSSCAWPPPRTRWTAPIAPCRPPHARWPSRRPAGSARPARARRGPRRPGAPAPAPPHRRHCATRCQSLTPPMYCGLGWRWPAALQTGVTSTTSPGSTTRTHSTASFSTGSTTIEAATTGPPAASASRRRSALSSPRLLPIFLVTPAWSEAFEVSTPREREGERERDRERGSGSPQI